jgi:hypothetical protein
VYQQFKAKKRKGRILSIIRLSVLFAVSLFVSHGLAQSIHSGFEALRTGSNLPIVSRTKDFQALTNPASRLHFTLGFGTDETNAPGTFFDSFSVTLETGDGQAAPLVTLDTTGAQWAPPTPGGLALDDAVISRSDLLFDRGYGNFALTYAYSVSVLLPEQMAGDPASLLFDLFDNQNGVESSAYFGAISVTAGHTNQPERHGLMSAASPQGPYAFEDVFQTNEVDRTVVLPKVPHRRFYQLRSEGACRFLPVEISANDFVFGYEFLAPIVALEKTATLAGPWSVVTNASVDLAERLVSTPWDPSARFYRLNGNLRTRITSFERRGNTLLIGFDFQPVRVFLQSSAQPDGPFALEQNARYDTIGQAVRLPRRGDMLFYRFSPSDPRELIDVKLVRDQVICGYRMRAATTNQTQVITPAL